MNKNNTPPAGLEQAETGNIQSADDTDTGKPMIKTENSCSEVNQEHIEQLLANIALLCNIPVKEKLTTLSNEDRFWLYNKIRNISKLLYLTLGYDSIPDEISIDETRFSEYTKITQWKVSPQRMKNLIFLLSDLFGITPNNNVVDPEKEQLVFFYKQIKQFTKVLIAIQHCDWNFERSTLPEIICPYLTDNSIPAEKRKEVFAKLIDRINFNSSILVNKKFIDYSEVFYQLCYKTIESYYSSDTLERDYINCRLEEKAILNNKELKQALLDLSLLLCPSVPQTDSDKTRLKALLGRVNQNIRILKSLTCFQWCDDFSSIQQVCLIYFSDNQRSKKERRAVNESLVKRINFNVFMIQQYELLSQFLSYNSRLAKHIHFFVGNPDPSIGN